MPVSFCQYQFDACIYIIPICQCHFVNINLMHVLDNFGLFYQ
ncbi:hypothetical protein AO377_1934 [Moraxella catarrhalis]|nr:hypothetical protein AO377_1934 [Moraxella catarrhalis]